MSGVGGCICFNTPASDRLERADDDSEEDDGRSGKVGRGN